MQWRYEKMAADRVDKYSDSRPRCNILLEDYVFITDRSGVGCGSPTWFNEMRVQCVEADSHAGLWRYEIGTFSVLIFRIAETNEFMDIVQHDSDRFPLHHEAQFHASHDAALTSAQGKIRKDGRGTRCDAVTDFSVTVRFPCPYDVFPDAVRILRKGGNPSDKLQNAGPLEVVVDQLEDVRSLFNTVANLKRAEDGIYHGSPGWGVEYHLDFSQNGAEVLKLTASPNHPQFVSTGSLGFDSHAYWASERLWLSLSALLNVPYEGLFPFPTQRL
jgi:hypothetical protein